MSKVPKFEIVEAPPAPTWPLLERQYPDPDGDWGPVHVPQDVVIYFTALGLPRGAAAAAVLRAGGRVSGPRVRIRYTEGRRDLIHSIMALPGVASAELFSPLISTTNPRGVAPTLADLEAAYLRRMTTYEGAVAIEADPEARAKTLALRQRVALLEERLEALAQIEALRAQVKDLDAQIAALPQVEV